MVKIKKTENIEIYSYFIYDFILDNDNSNELLLKLNYTKNQVLDIIYNNAVFYLNKDNDFPDIKTCVYNVFKNLIISKSIFDNIIKENDYTIKGITEFGLDIELSKKQIKEIDVCLKYYLEDINYGK